MRNAAGAPHPATPPAAPPKRPRHEPQAETSSIHSAPESPPPQVAPTARAATEIEVEGREGGNEGRITTSGPPHASPPSICSGGETRAAPAPLPRGVTLTDVTQMGCQNEAGKGAAPVSARGQSWRDKQQLKKQQKQQLEKQQQDREGGAGGKPGKKKKRGAEREFDHSRWRRRTVAVQLMYEGEGYAGFCSQASYYHVTFVLTGKPAWLFWICWFASYP